MKQINNHDFEKYCSPQQIERDFNGLLGLIDGITADGILHEKEIIGIANWLLATKHYEKKSPYSELVSILAKAISDFHLDDDEILNIKWFCEKYIEGNQYYDYITRGIQQLHGILDGIALDEIINVRELTYLSNWMDENSYLVNQYPYDEVMDLLSRIVADGVVEEAELVELMCFCELFKQNRLSDDRHTKSIVEHLSVNVFEPVTNFEVDGKKICVTGASNLYKREEIKAIITNKGGRVVGAMSGSVDYLIVCEERNSCWAYSMYGRKVEEAIKLKQKGAKVNILHIEDVYPFII